MSTESDSHDDQPVHPRALNSNSARIEPFDWYKDMRATSPIRYDERREVWDVFDYETISEILMDPNTFSSERNEDRDGAPSMLSSDPPKHTELRTPVADFFTGNAVAPLAPKIRRTADSLLKDVVDKGEMDVVWDYAYQLPIMTIADLLGVPPADREKFKTWSDTVVTSGQLANRDASEVDAQQTTVVDEMDEYFRTVIETRRTDPQDDLISKVLMEEDRGQSLTTDELLVLFRLLLIAGNVTTTNLITNGVWCFTNHDVISAVRHDEELRKLATEEVLRYRSPVQRTSRIALEDTKINGHQISKGEQIVTWIGSANRDEDVFEDSGSFIPDRKPNPHMAFGRGIHICLGAPLARLEAQIAFDVLFDHIENVSLVDMEYEPLPSTFLYGVRNLPITFDQRT